MSAPSLRLLSQVSTVLWTDRTSCMPFDVLPCCPGSLSYWGPPRAYRTSAVLMKYFSSTLAKFSDPERAVLHSPKRLHSTACYQHDGIGLFNSTIISWLNHFSCRFRLGWLPVLRLSLALPLRLQGLGNGCWLDFTVQDFPAIFHKLTNDASY